ncbi:MAG TPA: 30S ribosomal protein S17 [Myxococcales bacterium]|jgi:small subunit ribosomal protein S17|nr:30S ribosomal protein S17 [Myxococcales bacterium]
MSENTNQAPQAQRGQPKSRIGTVLSAKMTKTVVVQVERRMKHGRYGKYLTEKKKYKCHDENQSAKTGDRVRIVETRPLSKDKRWRVAEILVKAEADAQVKAEA